MFQEHVGVDFSVNRLTFTCFYKYFIFISFQVHCSYYSITTATSCSFSFKQIRIPDHKLKSNQNIFTPHGPPPNMINSHLKFFGLGVLGRLCVCGSTLAVFSTLGGLGRGSSCNRCVRGWCKRHWRMRTGSQRDRRMSWRPQRSWHMGTWRHSCNWGMRRRSHCGWRVSSRLICNNCSRSGWRMGRGTQGSWHMSSWRSSYNRCMRRGCHCGWGKGAGLIGYNCSSRRVGSGRHWSRCMGAWRQSCNWCMRGRADSGWSVGDNCSSWRVGRGLQWSRRMGCWSRSCNRRMRRGWYTCRRVGAGCYTCGRVGTGGYTCGSVCCGRSSLWSWLIIKDVRQISHLWGEKVD